jgi:hypothetical protein
MKKPLMVLVLMGTAISYSGGQVKADDSVVIRVGEASKVVLSIHDKKDLETLKHYNFQALMDDMISKIEKKDTTPSVTPSNNYLKDTVRIVTSDDWERKHRHWKHWGKRTYHSFNVDVGTNNYLANGKFPDQSNQQYGVRPWGSTYIGLNSIQRTHLAGKFFIEWGAGVSWYNFKFQDNSTLLTKGSTDVTFSKDPRTFDFEKSKLTATYLNVSFVPVLDFGRGGRKTTIFDGSRVDFSARGNHSSSFRIGFGPYAGYRIDSYSKQVYKDAGDEKKEHHHDNFYLNNIRYGARLQFGFEDVDFFFTYDLNNLFVNNKGPKLNAFSFGITF